MNKNRRKVMKLLWVIPTITLLNARSTRPCDTPNPPFWCEGQS